MSLSEKKEVREVTKLTKQGRYARSIENRLATGEEEGVVDESADEATEQRRHHWAPDPVVTEVHPISTTVMGENQGWTYCLKLNTPPP